MDWYDDFVQGLLGQIQSDAGATLGAGAGYAIGSLADASAAKVGASLGASLGAQLLSGQIHMEDVPYSAYGIEKPVLETTGPGEVDATEGFQTQTEVIVETSGEMLPDFMIEVDAPEQSSVSD